MDVGQASHGPAPLNPDPSLPIQVKSVAPQPRGMASSMTHPPVHTVSTSSRMSGSALHPVALHSAVMGKAQTESQASRTPMMRSAVRVQFPSIVASSSKGSIKPSLIPPGQLMAAAEAVSMDQVWPFCPDISRVDQSMRSHSTGNEKSQKRTGNGQFPGADRTVVGGSGGGGLAVHVRWNPWGCALASETKCTVREAAVE